MLSFPALVRDHSVSGFYYVAALLFPQAGDFGKIVDQKLKGRRNGFFIECGAADGQLGSNSMFLEIERNWTGLLVEANQRYYRTILGFNRQVRETGI